MDWPVLSNNRRGRTHGAGGRRKRCRARRNRGRVLCETTPQPEVQAYLGGGKSVRRLFVSACRRRFRRLYRLQLWCDGGFLLEVEIDEVVGS
jgi:hypothetical protein